MNTKVLLSASALVLGAAGIIGSFMPHEVLTSLNIAPQSHLPLLVQLLAATLFAFAMVNWMARGSLFGGIYNRPAAVGNVTHFVIGALALSKAVMAGARDGAIVTAAVVYVVFALGFGIVLFRSPVQRPDQQP